MSDTSKNIVPFLAGATIGAGLGILFAPDKGSKTRGKIKDGFVDLKDKAESKWHALEEQVEDLKEKVGNFLSGSTYKAEDEITFLEEKLAELKNKKSQT